MRKYQFFAFAFVLALTTVFSSCKKGMDSVGSTSEMLFVTQNNEQWNGKMGEAVREYFGDFQHGLPQPEKLFDVKHINSSAFDNIFKKYRNLIIGEIDPNMSKPFSVETKRNWMSSPQYVIKIKAQNEELWLQAFDSHKEKIKKEFNNNERERIWESLRNNDDSGIMKKLRNKYGFSMIIPKGYFIAKDNDNFTWIRHEERDKSLALFIYQLPYTSANELSEERIIEKTDSITRKYIPGPSEKSNEGPYESYMRLEKDYEHGKAAFKIIPDFPAGYAVEMRGMWDVANDFMAGPYVSYTIVNPEATKLICVEGYVYYPNHDKRDLLRQLEALIWSLKF